MTLPVQNSRDLLPAPKTIDEAMEIAKVLADSILVPKNFQKQPENILVAMMWSHTLGIPVVQGLQYIAVVGGRPCLFGDGMLAICMNSGLLEDIQETLKGSGTEADPLIATCTIKRRGKPSPIVSVFTQMDAKKAGLWNKTGPWTQYPKRMMKMRARSFALRDAFPDVLSGMSSAEEMQDVVDVEATAVISQPSNEGAEDKPAAPRRLPKRKAAAKPAEIENAPTPSAAEVLGTVVSSEPAPTPVPVKQPETVDPETGEIRRTEPQPEAASDADHFKAIAEGAQNYAELVRIWKEMPADLRHSEEMKRHFEVCRNRFSGQAQ